MITRTISIKGRRASMASVPSSIANGNLMVDSLQFICDEEWDGYALSAMFVFGKENSTYQVIVDTDGIAKIPPEALINRGVVTVGLVGILGESRITSTTVQLYISESAFSENPENAGEVTQSVADQLTEIVMSAKTKVESVLAEVSAYIDKEEEREASETERTYAEDLRIIAEDARVAAEVAREAAEALRIAAEEARSNAETERISAEAARVLAENMRATAESERTSNENERIRAEAQRSSDFQNALSAITTDSVIDNIKADEAFIDSLRGKPGKPGDPGKDGADGKTPKLTIGDVSTLDAGSKATVTLGGTDEEPVLSIGVPRGADGSDATVTRNAVIEAIGYTPADMASISGHIDDESVHVTEADKARWDNKQEFIGYIPASERRVDDLADLVGEHSAILDRVETTVNGYDAAINGATEKVDEIKQTVDGFSGAIDQNAERIEEHSSDTGMHIATNERNAWNAKQDKLIAGNNITIQGNVISSTGGGSNISDIRVGSTSIVDELTQIASVPIAGNNKFGVVGSDSSRGVYVDNGGLLAISPATTSMINARTNNTNPLVPSNVGAIVKAGMTDDKDGDWSATEKEKATSRIGAVSTGDFASHTSDSTVHVTQAEKDLWNSKGSSTVELDATLSVEGKAADAKAVGDAIAANKGSTIEQDPADEFGGKIVTSLNGVNVDDTLKVSGAAADAKAVGDELAQQKESIEAKQDRLTPGRNVTIADNMISAEDKWDLIETISPWDGTTLTRTAEPDGTPYDYRQVIIIVRLGVTKSSDYIGIRAATIPTTSVSEREMRLNTMATGTTAASTHVCRIIARCNILDTHYWCTIGAENANMANTRNAAAIAKTVGSSIKSIMLTRHVGVDTDLGDENNIEIWAVRA